MTKQEGHYSGQPPYLTSASRLGMKLSITPSVLRWAIGLSGYSLPEMAQRAGLPVDKVKAFLSRKDRPTLGEAKAIAGALRRPLAMFLLEAPPQASVPAVEFRHPAGTRRRNLNPDELEALRAAVRIQRIASWAVQETGGNPVGIPHQDIKQNPEQAAISARRRFDVPTLEQLASLTPAQALQKWRRALEKHGVLVFLLPVGDNACRGFSIWDEWAPLIVVNTALSPEARIFTLLHELGHLLTRTSSACLGPSSSFLRGGGDAIERWCETFAAAVLLPMNVVNDYLERDLRLKPTEKVSDLRAVAGLARTARVSLRATALRFIRAGRAEPSLYAAIPASSDRKQGGGSGGAGRTRLETRSDQYGERTARLFVGAVEQGALVPSDAMDYLSVSHKDLDLLRQQFAR